uniref:Peptidase S1 domain-containing protein n=1 Tax=Anopheles christyi TaxID=43041 RepID=A0A182K3Q4_9DIPT
MKLFVLASFVCCFGRLAQAQLRQVGGKDVSVRQYPFVAAIAYERQLNIGNGAIITPSWIITSASAVSTLPDGSYDVALGTSDFYSVANWYQVQQIFRHPEFVGWDYNIALIQIRGRIVFSDTIQPITIGSSFPDAIEATMLSYGKNEHETTHLRSATYTLISDNVDCVRLLDEYRAKEVIWQQHGFCLIPPPGTEQGQWFNDAGAPLVTNGQLYAVFAFAEHEGGTNEGSVATRVASFAGWIQTTMFKNS